MNQAIADIIKGHIEGLDFVDKIAGLVTTIYMDVKGPDGPVGKAFPVACCVTADDCKTGAYNDLMPDSSYKTVIYFEDEGMSFVRSESNWKYYTSTLKLVCWINVKKILGDTCSTGTACTLSAHLITEIIRALPEFPEDHTPFHRMYSEVTGQDVHSNSIFSKYTFDEKHIQYLMYPFDYFALDIKTDFAICMNSDVVPAPCDDVIDQMTPVAEEATGVGIASFTAHWQEETEALGYCLDVSTDANFVTLVVDNLDVGNVTEYEVTKVFCTTTYYYRVRAYDNEYTSDSSNVINLTTESVEDWFLPSRDELMAMYSELHLYGLGSFSDEPYWSSTESTLFEGKSINYFTGVNINMAKDTSQYSRACHVFTDTDGLYAIRDQGQCAGGYVFHIDGTTVYEAAPADTQAYGVWSNILLLIGTTSDAIGEGQNNTNEIIAQPGHTESAAEYCDELIV